MPSASLSRVVLSYPTAISLADDTSGGHPASWMQVARTGNFVSQRYGKFSITRADLAQMLNNFKTITPVAPTMLPVDYDHLSMDPKKPGDGMAAGWMKDLVLRDDGDTLWGLVEWTPDAATAISKRQYQFVSPSFVKDYVWKDGREIGTTLLAAAITNHPFLEGMAALTLSSGLQDLAHLYTLGDPPPFMKKKDDDAVAGEETKDPAAEAKAETPAAEGAKGEHKAPQTPNQPEQTGGSMTAGQKVGIKDDEVQKPEQIGVTFEIRQVVGEGADAFVSLLAPDGTVAEWFRANELQPAAAQVGQPQQAAASFTQVAPPQPAMPAAPAMPVPQATHMAATLPEVEGQSLTATLPEVEGTTLADTLPEVAGTTLAATLPEIQGKELAATLPEVEGKALAATLPEIEGKALAATLPEIEAQSLSAVPSQAHGTTVHASQERHMKTFELSDVNGAKVTVTEDAANALAEQFTKQTGTVVVNLADYNAMKEKVTTLSEQIDIMATATERAEKRARIIELTGELDRLSKGAFITKAERGWAEKTYADAVDLAGFKEWAATKTTPIVKLNTEVGSGLAASKGEGETATDAILDLAAKYQKELRLSHRDAVIRASRDLKSESEAYREQFSTSSVN
jgi:phage I-like protein